MEKTKKSKSLKRLATDDDWEVAEIVADKDAENETEKKKVEVVEKEYVETDAFEILEDPTLLESTDMKGKKSKGPILVQRSEVTPNISEFNLTGTGNEKISLHELVSVSEKLSGQDSVRKQLTGAKMLESLEKPLSKVESERIKRTVSYGKVCDEVSKWQPVVQSNQVAEQIVFPLKEPDLGLKRFDVVAANFVTKHPVAVAVSKLLGQSENVLTKKKELTPAEEKILQAMSLEEAQLRHDELMKQRAIISYAEAKARRQKKIKSKKYRHILKQEKMKKLMQEFENLKNVDGEEALKKLEEADNIRVLERMTLKHRNSGKWAQIQKLRAKYNPEARAALKEDLNRGRKLREKHPDIADKIRSLRGDDAFLDDMDVAMYEEGLIETTDPDSNRAGSPQEEEPESVSYSEMDTMSAASEEPSIVSKSHLNKHLQSAAFPAASEEELSIASKFNLTKHLQSAASAEKEATAKKTPAPMTSDFTDLGFITKPKVLKSGPEGETTGDLADALDDDDEDGDYDVDEGVKNISEAFADEGVMAEFRKRKIDDEEARKPKEESTYLPGWGQWAGTGIPENLKKKKAFTTIVAPPARKSDDIGHVIINEDGDKKASKYFVKELPFPYQTAEQFERFVQQPISHTWNPQSSYMEFNKPRVVTLAGKIIEPIDATDVLLDRRKFRKFKEPPIPKIPEPTAF